MKLDVERIDDLQINLPNGAALRVIQDTDFFNFGVDAVLLANFPKVKKGAKILDLCTGCGVIPLILSAKTLCEHITGVEIQNSVAALAKRSVDLNNIKNIDIVCDDLNEFCKKPGMKATFDIITCNPPYKEVGGGILSDDSPVAIARHEIKCTLEDVISASGQLLKVGGKLCLVHRPERLVDIIVLMKQYGIEPKRIQMVHPSPKKVANILLIEGTRGGKPKLFWEPPLYVYAENGEYSPEIQEIYGRR